MFLFPFEARLCSCLASSVSLSIRVKTRLTCKVCLGNQPPSDAVILCLPIVRRKPIAKRESNAGFYKTIVIDYLDQTYLIFLDPQS